MLALAAGVLLLDPPMPASPAALGEPLPIGRAHERLAAASVGSLAGRSARGADAASVGELRAVSFAFGMEGEAVFELAPFVFEPFDECLVSWNVRHTRETGFGVEIAVAKEPGGERSPWMWIGEWNVSERPRERVESLAGGRVDVDTFTSPALWREVRVRWRVRATDEEHLGASLDRLTLMPTRRAERGKFGPPAGGVARLPVPFRSQRDEADALAPRICSPTSLAMLLAYRGVEVPTAEVARRAYDPFHDIYGNWNRAIQAAYSFGLPGRLERIGSWARVEELLRARQPLIVSIAAKAGELTGAPYASTAGHLLVLSGLDERGNVLVNDPAAKPPAEGRLCYDRAEFEKVWLARGGTAYVLEAPAPEGR